MANNADVDSPTVMRYKCLVKRIQLYLTDEQVELLTKRAKQIGCSKSELIRRAIDNAYHKKARDIKVFREAVERSSGAWKGRTETGAEYVERMRLGVSDKVSRPTQDIFQRIEARKPTKLGRQAADLIHEERSYRGVASGINAKDLREKDDRF